MIDKSVTERLILQQSKQVFTCSGKCQACKLYTLCQLPEHIQLAFDKMANRVQNMYKQHLLLIKFNCLRELKSFSSEHAKILYIDKLTGKNTPPKILMKKRRRRFNVVHL
eukprot:Pgem_evm2s1454